MSIKLQDGIYIQAPFVGDQKTIVGTGTLFLTKDDIPIQYRANGMPVYELSTKKTFRWNPTLGVWEEDFSATTTDLVINTSTAEGITQTNVNDNLLLSITDNAADIADNETNILINASDIADRTKPMGNYTLGQTYQPLEQVLDQSYLAYALVVTDERPAPQKVGDPYRTYEGTIVDDTATGKQMMFGQRFTAPYPVAMSEFDLYIEEGQRYVIFSVEDPLGDAITQEHLVFEALKTGWAIMNINEIRIAANTVFDLVAMTANDNATAPVTWVGNYSYQTPPQDSDALPGAAIQSNKTPSVIKFNAIGQASQDNEADLDLMTIGDTFNGAGGSWTITSINKTTGGWGTQFEFGVSPATQGLDGIGGFEFITVVDALIAYGWEQDYYASAPALDGLYILDGDYANIGVNDNAYGMSITVQNLKLSSDWFIQSTPGGSTSGGDVDTSSFVDIPSVQTITGAKTFSTGIQVGEGAILNAVYGPDSISFSATAGGLGTINYPNTSQALSINFPDKSGTLALTSDITTPDLTGFIPYIGADQDVNLGVNKFQVEDIVTFKGTAETDAPALGADLIPGTTGSGGSWVGDLTTGLTNSVVTDTSLYVSDFTLVVGRAYFITVITTGATTGRVDHVRVGGLVASYTTGTKVVGGIALNTDPLTVQPQSGWDGTVTVTVQEVSALIPSTQFQNSLGVNTMEFRALNPTNTNFLMGVGSGKYMYNGIYNFFLGTGVGASAVSTVRNTGIGNSVLGKNSGGSYVTAVGYNVLNLSVLPSSNLYSTFLGGNIGGPNYVSTSNLGIGWNLFTLTTTANANVCIGYDALGDIVTGSANQIIGNSSLNKLSYASNNITIGNSVATGAAVANKNVMLGTSAGRFTPGGEDVTSVQESIFIGYYIRPLNTVSLNEVIIGDEAHGNGSNTVTLGNEEIIATYLKGNVSTEGEMAASNLSGTNTGDQDVSGFVPYVGAVSDVDLNGKSILNTLTFNGVYIALQDDVHNTNIGIGTPLTYNTAANAIGVGAEALLYNTGGQSSGVGFRALQQNTGVQANGFGYAALQKNTGTSSNGFGGSALSKNTGSQANGFGQAALTENTGFSVDGIGYQVLAFNSGNNVQAMGLEAMQYNTGDGSIGIGYLTGKYNSGENAIYIGHGAGATTVDNVAVAKDAAAADVDFNSNSITILGHGFGGTGDRITLRYTTTGEVIGGLISGTIYLFVVTDANTIQVSQYISSAGTDTHTFTPQFAYANIVALGSGAYPTKSNQITLGDANVTEVVMGNGDIIYPASASGNFVTIDTVQTITGAKTFTDSVAIQSTTTKAFYAENTSTSRYTALSSVGVVVRGVADSVDSGGYYQDNINFRNGAQGTNIQIITGDMTGTSGEISQFLLPYFGTGVKTLATLDDIGGTGNYVTLDTAQDITGQKTFTQRINASSIEIENEDEDGLNIRQHELVYSNNGGDSNSKLTWGLLQIEDSDNHKTKISPTGITFTDDSPEVNLFVEEPTAIRNILLPDASGTVALTSDLTSGYLPLTGGTMTGVIIDAAGARLGKANGRVTSIEFESIAASAYSTFRTDIISSSFTDPYDPGDGFVTSMFWDSSSRHDVQVFYGNGTTSNIKWRSRNAQASWGDWTNILQGSGSTNYIPKFTAGGTLGNSVIHNSSGDNITIGSTSSPEKFAVNGNIAIPRDNSYYFLESISGTKRAGISSTAGQYGNLSFNGLVFFTANNFVTPSMCISGDNGNVGIGTTSPDKKLEVTGTVQIDAETTGTDNMMLAFANQAKARKWYFYFDATTENLRLQSDALANIMGFARSTGNVGIGTTSPGAKLDVAGDARANDFILSGAAVAAQVPTLNQTVIDQQAEIQTLKAALIQANARLDSAQAEIQAIKIHLGI